MTPETEVPSLPKNILEMPDESIYHKSQADIDEKIDALSLKIVSTYLPHFVESTRGAI